MSFRYAIFPERKLIAVRFKGAVSEEAVISSSLQVCSDGRYQHGFDGIIDLRELDPRVTDRQMPKLVDFTLSKRKHGHGLWAVMVDTPSATAYTMLYQRDVAAKHPFTIFCSLEGAAGYLGIAPVPSDLEAFFNSPEPGSD